MGVLRRVRPAVLVPAVLLALSLLAAALVVRVVLLDGGNAESGETLSVTSIAVAPRTVVVRLPERNITLQVAPPVERVDGVEIAGRDYDDDLVAGRGRAIVGVQWTEELTGVPEDLPDVAVTLVARGARTELPALAGGEMPARSAPTVVVVDGDGTDVRVEVAFDGVTQVVDPTEGVLDAGLAAPLYEPEQWYVGDGDCSARPAARTLFEARPVRCEVSPVVLSPWRPGVGWVDSPQDRWATVDVSAMGSYFQYVGRRSGDRVDYEATRSRVLLTLDGQRPVQATPDQAGGSWDGTAVWSVDTAPTSLEVRQTSRLRVDFGPPRGPRTLSVRDTVDLLPAG